MNRNHLIAGLTMLAILGILSVIGLGLLVSKLSKWEKGQPHIRQQAPISELTYCSADHVDPCIVSFGFDADGNMLVNLFIPDPSFPRFHLKIIQNMNEVRYACRRTENFPTSFYCMGAKMPPGELMHFIIIENGDKTTLAEGDLSILGLVYPTLEVVFPETVPPATEAPADELFNGTPASTRPNSAQATPTIPSYPNPSDATPSYP